MNFSRSSNDFLNTFFNCYRVADYFLFRYLKAQYFNIIPLFVTVPSSEDEVKTTINKNMEKVKEKLAGFAKIMESEHVSSRRRSNPSSQVIYTSEKLAKRKKQTSAVHEYPVTYT